MWEKENWRRGDEREEERGGGVKKETRRNEEDEAKIFLAKPKPARTPLIYLLFLLSNPFLFSLSHDYLQRVTSSFLFLG